LLDSELLHKEKDFVDALIGWRRHSALAILTEEPTTGKKDKKSCMMGPYFWDSAWMDWWGSEPMRFRFPMMGHCFR
jgi:hypothetical protein